MKPCPASPHAALIFLGLLVFASMGLAAEDQPSADATPETVGATSQTTNAAVSGEEYEFVDEEGFDRLKRLEKPDVFHSWTQRLDFIHNNVTLEMQSHVDKVDGLFASETEAAQPIPHSRFQFGSFVEFSADRGVDLRINPSAEVDVKLPNLERRLSLFIDNGSSADLPGTTISEQERGFNAGLRRATKNFRLDGGVKVRLPPVLFGRIDWRPKWRANAWHVFPLGRVYWESDDGYGTLGSLTAYRYFNEKWILSSATAVRWTEKANSFDPSDYGEDYFETTDPSDYYFALDAGVEWEQSFVLGRVAKALNKKNVGTQVSMEDTARATGVRLSFFGNTERADGLERARITFGHRRPIYQNWIYLSVMPEFEMYNDGEWHPVPRIRIGVDMLFWASSVSGERLRPGARHL